MNEVGGLYKYLREFLTQSVIYNLYQNQGSPQSGIGDLS
jgi:hypothetical protein